MFRIIAATALGVTLAFAVPACVDANAPNIGPPGLAILSGADQIDTVQAVLRTPLLVEVRDSTGRPLVGVRITFTGHFHNGLRSAVSADTTYFSLRWSDTTDTRGRSRAFVQLGTVAGPTHVTIALSDSLGHTDSIRAGYVVRAGQPVGIVIAVADSSAYAGQGYTLSAAVGDRFGNSRTEPVSYQSLTPTIVAVGDDGTIDALSIGRAAIRIDGAGFVDTAWVTVPPVGTIAAVDVGDVLAGAQPGLVLVNLDGSGYRRIGSPGELPEWTVNGDSIVYGRGSHLYLLDTLGATERLFVASGTISGEAWVSLSQDGNWAFFNGAPGQCQPLYRSHADGTSPVWVGPTTCSAAGRASSSPDGSKASVVFGGGIGILDVGSGVIDTLIPWVPSPSTDFPPRWSPDGTTLAYVRDTHIRLITPTGGPSTPLTQPDSSSYLPLGFKWSRDSKWLVARRSGALDLIRIQDGLRLPLAWSARLYDPAWRPD